jgi:flavin reductase (DIM6/NTAB) family NADH-FMN oxidoreductase RutF
MTDDARQFRHILGHYPTGVCAVTAIGKNGNPIGLVVGSFTSVSLDPPLVGFFPDKNSTTWPQIKDAGRFCINVLGDAQKEVCARLAAKGDDKFHGIDFHLSNLGSPIIEGVLAWIDCHLDAVHDAGDHFIVLGHVAGLDLHADGSPMVFHKGSYSRVVPI